MSKGIPLASGPENMATTTAEAGTKTPHRALLWRQFATPFHFTIALVIAVLVPLSMILAAALQLRGLAQVIDLTWPGCSVLLACAIYCRWRPLPRLIETCDLALISLVFFVIFADLTLLAARSHYGLVDAQLSAIDAAFHFKTGYFVESISRFPLAAGFLQIIYKLCIPMMVFAVVIPPFFGHAGASRKCILAIVFAAIATATIFWFLPAAGPWTVQGFRPSNEQAAISSYLSRLKVNAPFTTDCRTIGIISFPSFHVVLAIVSAAAIGSIRALRIAAWTLAALVCTSTITTGWHYGVDVLGGFILAWAAMVLARRIDREPTADNEVSAFRPRRPA